ncbi:nuclear transport factor 2 family protein [Roseateles sp. BYS78W]|uniref:Nuclear transport factor 2 family protein n=1 Tax=Pelomonas candidula TaxID=3299025 RepID=A0ABW7H992_9BURK
MKKTPTLALSLLLVFGAAALPAARADDAKPAAASKHANAAANKALVLKAYQALFGDHDLSAVDRYWAKDYIQHNPYMADGTEAVKQFVEKIGLLNGPKFKVEFLRVAAEGDLVFVQTRQPKMGNTPEMVIVDIFRVANGKIAEHWDVMQAVPADAVNKRPMY